MSRAPENPSTEELHHLHPLSDVARSEIALVRQKYSETILLPEQDMIGIIGHCSHPGYGVLDLILEESSRLVKLESELGRRCLSNRVPPWKPRTNPNDWHGEEITDPLGVFRSIKIQADAHANVSCEIGYADMISRYSRFLSFAWIGSRNAGQMDLAENMSIHDPHLPVGVKNGLDGNTENALRMVDLINDRRQGESPAVLIFRGGNSYLNPKSWEDAYKKAHDRTKGRLIVDTAHGTEMAHDPNGNFNKSVSGQINALEHLIDLALTGYKPAGVMIEASDQPSRTDPVIPLQIALDGFRRLLTT